MEAGQAGHQQWLQQELRKLPTSEMQTISVWLQQVLQERVRLEAEQSLKAEAAKAAAAATPAGPSAEPREKASAGLTNGAGGDSSKAEAAKSTPKSEPQEAKTEPMQVDPSRRPEAKAESGKQPEARSVAPDAKKELPASTSTPVVNGTSTETAAGPQRGSRSRSRSPKKQASAPKEAPAPVAVAREPISAPKPQPAPVPSTPAQPAPAPAAQPPPAAAKADATPSSEVKVISAALDKEHTEMRSSLWSAFSAANDVRSRVSQVEQNFNTLQAQSQQAAQKADESFIAVQHWTGMVEQCRMEHAAVQTPWHEPHFQAQAQQRLATAMQSHSFAVQSSDRAQLHRKTAEAAVKDAADALTAAQEELRASGIELQEVVKSAEDFLKKNSDSLPQEKAQPLASLCTRFMQFAQQLGASQDELRAKPTQPELTHTQAQVPTPAQPKPFAAGVPGGSLHPLPAFQQRVMIVEEESKPNQEEQPMELFGEEDHDLQSADPFPHEMEPAVEVSPEAAAEKRQEELAAYKNRLLSEASYLQAVFGGKKEDG